MPTPEPRPDKPGNEVSLIAHFEAIHSAFRNELFRSLGDLDSRLRSHSEKIEALAHRVDQIEARAQGQGAMIAQILSIVGMIAAVIVAIIAIIRTRS